MARLVPHPPISRRSGDGPVRRRVLRQPEDGLSAADRGDAAERRGAGIPRYGLSSLLTIQPVVYACILATTALGQCIADRRSVWQVGAAALAGSLLFYVVTNFATWAGGHLYPMTASGLAECYIKAIPYFGNSLCGRRRLHDDPVRRAGEARGPRGVDARGHRAAPA